MMRSTIQRERRGEGAATLARQLALLDALMLRHITADSEWSLVTQNFGRLEEEFRQLQDAAEGGWQDELLDQVVAMKELVMSAWDRKFFEKHPDPGFNDRRVVARAEGIVNRAYTKLRPLWSFTMAMCGLLNSEENAIMPEDAWWLGLIDEVVGTPRARGALPLRVSQRLLAQLPIAVSQRFC